MTSNQDRFTAHSQRGISLGEFLVALVVLSLFLVVAYGTLLPVIHYMDPAQAKINTQQNAVPLLYKLQRQIRQSDYRVIYVWQSGVANPLPSTLTDIQTFAVATAQKGTAGAACYPGGDFATTPSYGSPYWQGFDVFMLQGGALKCVFEPLTPARTSYQGITSTDAATAITAAGGVANPSVFGNAVLDIKIQADPLTAVVDYRIKAVSTVNGRSNATTYTEDILTRD